jgi:hypothetical protein
MGADINSNLDKRNSGVSSATTVTYNGNPSFATIGKPCLDYYAGITRQTSDSDIKHLAQECIDSDLSLAIVTFFQKRDCRGGSGERKPFILSMKKIPGELRRKLYRIVPEFGYWNDLNKFARAIPEDQDFIANLFAVQLLINIRKFITNIEATLTIDLSQSEICDRNLEKWLPTENQKDDKTWDAVDKIIEAFNKNFKESLQLRYVVINNIIEKLKHIIIKLDNEATLKYSTGENLIIESNNKKVNLLVNKFQHILDKASNLPVTLINLRRTGYRKWCSFARSYYNVVEHFKSPGNWSLINYPTVPSIAFDRTKKQFEKHDEERFKKFIHSVKRGRTKINVSRLMPYELLGQESNDVRDEQWNQIVKETNKFYKNVPRDNVFHPENSIHVADVSASMTFGNIPKPINVSLSLALLMSEVSGRPMYTFSAKPIKYEPNWESLSHALDIVTDANYDTNFHALVDQIYDDCMYEADQIGVAPSEIIPGSIYVYTDGGFNKMCKEQPTTAIDYIKNKFGKFKKVPIIIFWNVAGNVQDFAVDITYTGVVQLSGFTKDAYQIFTRLTSIDEINPEGFFRKAVLCERYQPVLNIYNEWLDIFA